MLPIHYNTWPLIAQDAAAWADRVAEQYDESGTRQGRLLNVTTLVCSNRSYDILKVEMVRAGYVPMGRNALALTDLGTHPWIGSN